MSQMPIDRVPFLRLLGLQQLPSEAGRSRLWLPELKDEFCNMLQAAHGGVLMTLLDVTMAMAGRSRAHHADDEQAGLVTIEMKTSFMQPAQGPRIASHGRCVYRTRTMAFCEADLFDGGHILDPNNGKVYRSQMRLGDGGRKLDVRGYIGLPLLGRTQTWLREE